MASIVNCLIEKLTSLKVITLKEDGFEVELYHRYLLAGISAASCLVYYLVCSLLFVLMSKTYKNLSHKDKMFWSLAFVRGTYGLLGALFSAYSIYFESDQFTHITRSFTKLSSILVPFHLGFFIFEWSAQILFDIRFKTLSTALHAHHSIAFIGFYFSSITSTGHWTALRSFTLELSTPFSCICYCLIKANQQESFLWKANQFVLVHTFHIRSIIECTMIYETYTKWSEFLELPPVLLIVNLVGLIVVGLFLTPYWTYKKTQQMFLKQDWNDSPKVKKQ